MMDLRDVAMLEEDRLALGMTEVALETRRVSDAWGGGVVTRGEPGTWVNTAVGFGLRGPVSRAAVDSLVEFHESGGVEPRIEVCPFADPSALEQLEAARFAIRLFENVFFRPLGADGVAVEPPAPHGVRIGLVDPSDAEVVEAYCRAVTSGFAEPAAPSEGDMALARRIVGHPRVASFAAFDPAGKVVGGGALEVHGQIAALFGLSVAPAFRRRGIQLALMAARLRRAAERGARVATISSKPGVATERNARRMGFEVAYTRVALARAGPGLVAAKV